MFPWDQVDDLLAMKSEDVELILFAQLVSKIFHLTYVVMIHQRHRQTDRQTDDK